MYDRILLPTDGSQPAEAAARYGIALAARFDAALHVLSVVDTRQYSDEVNRHPRAQERQAALEADARDAVAALERIVEEAAASRSTSSVEYGVPYEAIPAYATENGIDLVVMGTHGRSGLDRMLVGSITERVVRTSETPVFAVPPTQLDREPPDYETLLLPTDGSPAAQVVLEHGLSIAERFGARVHALSVVTGGGLLTPSETDPSDAEAAVEAIADEATQRGIEVTTHVQEGKPAEAIRAFITDEGIDLVAMGTHGRSGTTRYVFGSVTEKVIRTSDAPVLSARLRESD